MIGSEMCPCGCGLTAIEARADVFATARAALDTAADTAADQARELIRGQAPDAASGEEAEASQP